MNFLKSINLEKLNNYFVDTMIYSLVLCFPAALLTLVGGDFGYYISYLLADLIIVTGLSAVLAGIITTYLIFKQVANDVKRLFDQAGRTF